MSAQYTPGLVSIIIPIYNVGAYLPRCLDSVLAQTYPHWEALCVDDGSTDDSGTVLDAYAAKDTRIRCIHQSNAGVSAARNAALDIMQGEYLTMLDSDDSIEPNMLEEMVRAMKEYAADIVFTGAIQHGEDGCVFSQAPFEFGYPERGGMTLQHVMLECITPFNWSKLFKANLFRKANLRYEKGIAYGEDVQLNLRYLMYCKRVAALDAALYHYYRRGDSATRVFHRGGAPMEHYEQAIRLIPSLLQCIPEEADARLWYGVLMSHYLRVLRIVRMDVRGFEVDKKRVMRSNAWAGVQTFWMPGMRLRILFAVSVWALRRIRIDSRRLWQRNKSKLKRGLKKVLGRA